MADKQVLAKVTGELSASRGPDVRSKIVVPADWLMGGGQLIMTRPRLASCEQCKGGGCAVCDYQGAFTLSSSESCERVPLRVNAQPTGSVVTVRLPHLGFKRETDEAAGHWLVEVHPGSECSPGVTLTAAIVTAPSWFWKLTVMVVVLALLWAWLSST